MYQIKVAHFRTGTKYNLFTPSFDSIPVEYITLAILMSKHDWVAIFRLLISQLLEVIMASCSYFHSYNMKGMQCFYPIGHPLRKTTVINKYKIVELKQMSLILNVQITKEKRRYSRLKKAKNVTFIQKDLSHFKYLVRTILLLRLKKMSVSQNSFH